MISADKYTGGDENGPRLAVGAFYFKRIAVRCPQLKYLRESGLQILQCLFVNAAIFGKGSCSQESFYARRTEGFRK